MMITKANIAGKFVITATQVTVVWNGGDGALPVLLRCMCFALYESCNIARCCMQYSNCICCTRLAPSHDITQHSPFMTCT